MIIRNFLRYPPTFSPLSLMVLCPSVYHCGYFPPYKASFILAAKKFRKLIFKHMLLPPASLADENWLFLTKKEGIIFCANDIKE